MALRALLGDDVHPATKAAFSKAGLTDLTEILCRSVPEIVAQTGLKASQVADVVCRLSLHAAPKPSTAAHLLTTATHDPISWGDAGLDRVGPIRTGHLIDLCGESSAGKTQLALQLCLAVQQPPECGGISARAVFINTEARFPMSRWHQLAKHCAQRYPSLASIAVSDNVFTNRINTADEFWMFVHEALPSLLSSSGVRLVVIDSIAALFRADFALDESAARAHVLFDIGRQLKQLAHAHKTAIVCINQVSAHVPEEVLPSFAPSRVIPALGLAWSSCINARYFVRRITSREASVQAACDVERQLSCALAPHLPEERASFFVDNDGCHSMEQAGIT
ncbi:hypothetical protein PTSG_00395 [Salpingoeca rosetta]|uniref:RecA family profile 1 domain-containing protein n=1 Tax=Salpingoeca rosetta (strain ATCC 50818 / BSB-021) TaxID=946362 RepID=F2TWC9_SALR5|nr:uncharacterized protein PTSG_00395 [Salpingoeca rosetta]EGD72375.1 hypothetical protein PTSG_00395 [Salpingoeca rosetta]|eukprot:XP_004998944.1 hypothetical protein PTSG_00395 [Salpingoeca rosetta]